MALLEKLRKKKSQGALTAKAVVPESAPAVKETSEGEKKKHKRKSQATEDTVQDAPVSSLSTSQNEPARKKSRTKALAGEPPVKLAEDQPTADTAGVKKGKGKQEKDIDVSAPSELHTTKGQDTETLSETKGKDRRGKSVDGAPDQHVPVKKVTGKMSKEKGTKSLKGAEVDDAQSVEGVKTKKKKKQEKGVEAVDASVMVPGDAATSVSKKTKKGSGMVSTGISHPTLSKASGKKAKHRVPSPEPEPTASDDVDDPAVEEGGKEENVHLYGFSTDDDDSSDEDVDSEWGGIDVAKLPTVAKDDAVVKKKLERAKKLPTGDRGVIYLGRIPHGFYEDQMRQYFSQFGTVTRLRLSRNKKTGRSKHYAFIEFDSSSVADIVAETMDNYLLMGHILTCKVIPKDEVHPELWIGANRKWRMVPRDRVARVRHNKPRTQEEQEKAEKRLLKRQEQRKRKLEEAGIKYDFSAVAYKKSRPTEA